MYVCICKFVHVLICVDTCHRFNCIPCPLGLLDLFCWRDEAVANQARAKFDAHWTDPSALSSDYKSAVYKIVLKNGGLEEYEAILKTFYETEDNSIKKFSFCIGATSSPELKLRTLDWCVKSGDVKLQDFFYPIGSISTNTAGADMTWTYFQDNWEHS